MTFFAQLVVLAALGFIAFMPPLIAALIIHGWRARTRGPFLRIASAAVVGFAAGAGVVWLLVSRAWNYSFLTTLAASGNAAKYGHPVEHTAETILVWMAFAALLGALSSVGLAAVVRKRPHTLSL